VKLVTASWLICETEIDESWADLPPAAAVTTIGATSAASSAGAAAGWASCARAGVAIIAPARAAADAHDRKADGFIRYSPMNTFPHAERDRWIV
jgi:hypothetical protein